MKRWYAPKHGGYMIFVNEGFNSIVPQSDIVAHTIDSLSCSCNPSTNVDTESGTLHVVHSSFEEQDAMKRSLTSLGIK